MTKKEQADKELKEVSIPVEIENFEIKSYSFNGPDQELDEFGYNLDVSSEQGEDFLAITIKLEVKKAKDAKRAISKIETVTTFEIGDKPEDLKGKALPNGIRYKLLDIAYSTTRGAFLVKSEENFLSNFPLPLLDIEEIRKAEVLRQKSKEDKENKK